MGVGTPEICKKNCRLDIYWYQSKTSALAQAVQKIDFCGSIWEGSKKVLPQTMSKFLSHKYLLLSIKNGALA